MSAVGGLGEFFLPMKDWGDPANEAIAAKGSRVAFADGTEAICMVSGLWNANLGYGNLVVASAIDRVNRLASTLPLFRRGSSIAREAVAALLQFLEPQCFNTCWFSTSGSAAIDTSIKMLRQYHALSGNFRRQRILSFSGSYHGMTMGAMAVTGEYLQQETYGIDQRLFMKIPHDDPNSLDLVLNRYGSELAAVIVEPVLGSGTIVVPDPMIDHIFECRKQYGFSVVADEVATGFYRTGPKFASHLWSTQPDVLITSKALTNGTCAGSAILASPAITERFHNSDATFWHGETQAGSPQTCAAILATIQEFGDQHVDTESQRVARELDGFIQYLVERSAHLSAAGRGCFRSIVFKNSSAELVTSDFINDLVKKCRDAGVLVQPGPGRIQFVPNLLMSDKDLNLVTEKLSPVILAAEAELP